VVIEDGQLTNFIEKIIDKHKVGHGKRYLVHWVSLREKDDEWPTHQELEDCEALDIWEKEQSTT